jgi:CAAD domains of cyanobacterial aminoacyl-tRNA synthetase
MKYDIALHEIMRIDEYADEEAKAKEHADPNQSVAQDSEGAATDTVQASTMSESPSSIDIPSETVINYDEPPAIDDAIEVVESTTDSAEKTMMDAVETIESTTDAAKENMMDTVETVQSTTDAAKENVMDAVESTTDSAKETLETIQTKAPGVFNELTSAVPAFFQQNRQLLTNIGLIFLAFVVVKLTFAGIDAIDDLPLVTPLLKIVGLVYVGKFIWNYVIRKQDRDKLVEKFNTTKVEVLGNRE